MASPVPEEFKKNQRLIGFFRKDERDFVEQYLKEHQLTIRQLVLKTLKFVPSNEYL